MDKSESPHEEIQLTHKEENIKLARLHTLLTHRQHAERIFWSRIQTLHLIQAGILAAGYILSKNNLNILAIVILFFGAFLTLLLGRLAYNDWSDASVNKDITESLCDELKIRRTAKRCCLLSHQILFLIIGVFFVADIVLATLVSAGVTIPQ